MGESPFPEGDGRVRGVDADMVGAFSPRGEWLLGGNEMADEGFIEGGLAV